MAGTETSTLVVAPTQQFVSCPSCRTGIGVRDQNPLDGAKLLCPRCGTRFVLKVSGPG